MKVNLKRKVMLALLAGGMLCANSAFAVNWYGNGGNSIVDSAPSPEVLTGVNMTIDDSTTVGGNTVSDVNNIFGGRTAGAETVTGNSITFNTTNVTTINANIYAGRSGSGSATDNSVTIEDGFFDGNDIYGGRSSSGTATGNSMTIEGGTFDDVNIYAGYSAGGTATGNSVTIEDGTFNSGSVIYGGNGTAATGNSVTIEDGTFNSGSVIYGGNGTAATGNSVTIEDGTFNSGSVIRGGNGSGTATGNSVTIKNGTFNSSSDIGGGYSFNGTATGNSVTVEDGTFSGADISGGSSFGVGSNVMGNSVIVKDGTFDSGSYIQGGFTTHGTVTGNSVTVEGGTFNSGSEIHGGRSNHVGTITGNSVTVKDGIFDGTKICGGWTNSAPGSATNNSVNIEDGTFNNVNLYGGYAGASTSSNNTLNLKIKMGGKQNEVKYFQNMNFYLPSDITNGDIMMETTSVAYDNTTIGVTAANGVQLNIDDKIYLIKSDAATGTISNDGAKVLGGTAIISLVGNDLILTYLGIGEDQQKAPVEGIATAMAMVNQCADLASREGMESLLITTEGGKFEPFAAANGGHSKYKTGSHIDVNGWEMLVGAGTTNKLEKGGATSYGLFFEYGKGDFDTYNGNVHGDGNTENKGVGIMFRHRMKNNTYFEGNIRYGKQETEWGESDLGNYDADSRYYGAIVAIGHIYKKGNNKLDTYLRYAYGHVGACDARVGDNDYHFDSIDSHRVRAGVRYTFGQRELGFKPYIGAAWEHEFNGEAKASIAGIGEAPAPTLKGNTGIFELGFDWDADTKWVFGLNANAYIGKRKGWDGTARVFYNF